MLYPCIFCVALLMDLFVFCVACLTAFVNCLVKQFAMCLGVVPVLLLNVMDVFSVYNNNVQYLIIIIYNICIAPYNTIL